MNAARLVVVAGLLEAWALPAQTFVVSAAGGPGVAFTSIATAVAAAPNGAILRVLPGSYASFTIDGKSLTVLGGPGVLVDQLPFGGVQVQNLALSQVVVLHGLQMISGLAAGGIRCQSCQGTVVVQSCRAVPASGGSLGGMFSAQLCREVRVLDCEFDGPAPGAMVIDSSSAFVAGTTLRCGGFGGPLAVVSGHVELVDANLVSLGLTSYGAALYLWPGASARLSGATTLHSLVQGASQGPGIGGFGSVILDPGVQVFANVPIEATVAVTMRTMPALTVSPVPLGAVASASLTVPPGGVGGLLVGWPVPAYLVAPFTTTLAIDLATMVPVASGTVGPLVASYAVPATAALAGVRVVWQGWSFDASGGFQASNAVDLVHW